MRKEEVRFICNQIFDLHFFYPHQDITTLNVCDHFDTFSAILFILIAARFAFFADNLDTLEALLNFNALRRREWYTFVRRYLSFADKTDRYAIGCWPLAVG